MHTAPSWASNANKELNLELPSPVGPTLAILVFLIFQDTEELQSALSTSNVEANRGPAHQEL